MARSIKSTTHSEELLAGVAELLSDTTHKHSDVQLKVGGKIFHCHKIILAIKSPYFDQKLFPLSSSAAVAAAAASEEIVLNDVSADGFEKVLQFMYTGETELSDENVEHILKAADLMKLTELKTFCADYLTDNLSVDTCPRYWKIAEQLNLATLALACKRLCVKEFGNIRGSSVLGSLSEKMMTELLEDDDLVVESEVDVCETLMKWLNSQTQNDGHSVQPYQLLTHIRWSGVPVEYVKTKLLTNSVLMTDRQCFEFLSKVISYRLTGVQFNGLNTFHRPSTGVEQCVVVVGVDHGITITSEVYRVSLQRKEVTTCTQEIPCCMQMEAAACVFLCSQIYVIGVGESKNETWKWDLVVGWTRCADMIKGRRRHCATFVNNTSMCVLGGFDDKVTLDRVDQYSTLTNKWTNVGQLNHASWGATCVVYKTSVYVFGGADQNDDDLDCVQVFDTATKLCTVLTQRLPQPQRLLRAVMWDKSVIIINRCTCLIFDLEQHTFQERDQFAADVVHFGLVLENERIFIIGGDMDQTDSAEMTTWICSDEVKSVAVTDIINNQPTPNWTHHTTLPTPAAIHAYAAMTLPA